VAHFAKGRGESSNKVRMNQLEGVCGDHRGMKRRGVQALHNKGWQMPPSVGATSAERNAAMPRTSVLTRRKLTALRSE